jgi:hypothetical protein
LPKIKVHAFAFLQIALKDAAEIEISTAPGDFSNPRREANALTRWLRKAYCRDGYEPTVLLVEANPSVRALN